MRPPLFNKCIITFAVLRLPLLLVSVGNGLSDAHAWGIRAYRRCRVAKQGEEEGSSMQEMLRQTYKEADDRWREVAALRFAKGEVDVGMAGSCSLTVLLRGRSLYVANTGDSSAMLVRCLSLPQVSSHRTAFVQDTASTLGTRFDPHR